MFLIWLFGNIIISVSAKKFYLRAKVARVGGGSVFRFGGNEQQSCEDHVDAALKLWKWAAKPRGTTCLDNPHFLLPSPLHILTTQWQVLWIVKRNFQLSKQNYQMRCLLDCSERQSLSTEEIKRNVSDNCRLCCCPLKIKFGEFKHFHAKPYQGLQVRRISKLHFVRNLKLV